MTDPAMPPKPPPPTGAKFVTGSTMRHVIEMTATGSIGLMAIFAVDLLSLLYVSMLKNDFLTAGVGYAALLNFFAISINIGMMIATTALTARFIGAGDRTLAKRMASSAVGWSCVVSIAVTLVLMPALPFLLDLIGARDEAYATALRFLWITLPSGILVSLGMSLSGVLRAVGDANRAMYVTLAGGIATAIFDPILIFGLRLGITGAAIVVVISRVVFSLVGLYGVCRIHRLVTWPQASTMRADARPIFAIAVPAILTNIATPLGNTFLVTVIGRYGAQAIAASAIIDRITPVAFGALFALSAGVGPILSQNFGARQFERMNNAMRDALIVMVVYVLCTWCILMLTRGLIAALFHSTPLTSDYVSFFCLISGLMWMFNGFLFTANAAFNNLGFPIFSTMFNWLRATLGIVPFSYYGSEIAGFQGALVGVTLGGLIFGTAAIVTAFAQLRKIARDGQIAPPAILKTQTEA